MMKMTMRTKGINTSNGMVIEIKTKLILIKKILIMTVMVPKSSEVVGAVVVSVVAAINAEVIIIRGT